MTRKLRKNLIIAGVCLVVLLIVFLTCTATVETGYTGIVTTFGRVEDVTLEAGFHVKSPFQKIVLMLQCECLRIHISDVKRTYFCD